MPEQLAELDPILLLVIVACGGAFGGLCDLLAIISAGIGAAGAIALQFIFVLLQSFKSAGTTPNIVFLFSISVAAGFGAKRLLPIMTSRLERQIQEVKKRQMRPMKKQKRRPPMHGCFCAFMDPSAITLRSPRRNGA
jgi:hypothetical protein